MILNDIIASNIWGEQRVDQDTDTDNDNNLAVTVSELHRSDWQRTLQSVETQRQHVCPYQISLCHV